MDEHGRKYMFLFEDIKYLDENGLTVVSDKSFVLWANEGYIEKIKNMNGISAAHYGLAEKGKYEIYIDPRYDIDFVKKEIEAIIMCAEE